MIPKCMYCKGDHSTSEECPYVNKLLAQKYWSESREIETMDKDLIKLLNILLSQVLHSEDDNLLIAKIKKELIGGLTSETL